MTILKRVLAVLAVLLIVAAAFFAIRGWVSPPQAASIGIIGGADGPTAIFVTSYFSPSLFLGGAALLVLLVLGVVHLFRK